MTAAATGHLDEDRVRAALREIPYPGFARDIVSFGLVSDVVVRPQGVTVTLTLSTDRPEVPGLLSDAIRDRLGALGVERVEVGFLEPRPEAAGNRRSKVGRLASVRHVVAVGSGKGGVGKSTVAVNVALALKAEGLGVGLLDTDIYGPSLPTILGIDDAPQRARMTGDRKILPLDVDGLSFVSFGFFLGPRSPVIWRGPLVAKAVEQVSRGVVWPDLDVLIVDLPPGTGDVPLTLAQTIVVDGAVIVTTPQRVAVEEAEKAVGMFRRLGIPTLGVVENMSYARCACGAKSWPFGRGGGEGLAERSAVPMLGSIPLCAMVDPETGEERPVRQMRILDGIDGVRGEADRRFQEIATRIASRLEFAGDAGTAAATDPGSPANGPAAIGTPR